MSINLILVCISVLMCVAAFLITGQYPDFSKKERIAWRIFFISAAAFFVYAYSVAG